MKYLIGIDGGGTGSTCVIADLSLKVLHTCNGGPTNILKFDQNKISETITNLIKECCKNTGSEYSEIAALVIGTAGAGNKENAELFKNSVIKHLSNENISIKNIIIETDARIAIEGAFSGGTGSILIAGTGSIIFGKNEKGEIFRNGGFGRTIGDEGGGYSIGRKGLNAVSKVYDGRIQKNKITDLLLEKYNIDSPEKLIDEIYKNNFDIASVAPLVIEAGEKNDPEAVKTLDEESDELVLCVKRMFDLLKMEKMKLAFIGSLISNSNFYSRLLKSK
ncbi:MAG TPA: BadF/BadG/BcrA/BcrD ATPase family protein, partial [Ignavibacteriaceae bacterium]|nr:BadF/BadG/BcrA/BcrD ATPase family protein [Ignavibacteriaceae bacterium]